MQTVKATVVPLRFRTRGIDFPSFQSVLIKIEEANIYPKYLTTTRLPTVMNNNMIAEFTMHNEWNHDSEMISDEEFSATSHEEAGKVFEQWQTDNPDDLDIMEVDEQLGPNLLGDDIFHDPCMSPTGPLEELILIDFDDEDLDRFSLSFLEDDQNDATISLPFDERYKDTLTKLAESMKRSQETRKSLQMKTPKTKDYTRTKSVSGVLSSIEKSSQQLQVYLKSIRQS